jgi:hypothetical protein
VLLEKVLTLFHKLIQFIDHHTGGKQAVAATFGSEPGAIGMGVATVVATQVVVD